MDDWLNKWMDGWIDKWINPIVTIVNRFGWTGWMMDR